MKDKQKKQIENFCEKCGSYYTYRTINEIVCRKCGHRKEVKK